ncbi:hypothetical protein ABW20_dc0107498 [Dactylellina cionopaga]|nr:hypothetical protein ABW20_dc0107498 [Dactylellina cionopaga]
MVSHSSLTYILPLLPLYASLVSGIFTIGVYDKAKLALLDPDELAMPDWVLCHPNERKRWGVYAVDALIGCDLREDIDYPESESHWVFQIPGNQKLDAGEEISQFYIAGPDSTGFEKIGGDPTITYDSQIKNTYFSYGYLDGSYTDAPFRVVRDGKAITISSTSAPRTGDVLDFVGVTGTPEKDRVLRLQTLGGEGSKWHLGRGAALPVSETTPVVEFRVILKSRKATVPAIAGEEEQIKVIKEGPGFIEEDDYRAYDDIFTPSGNVGKAKNIMKSTAGGLFGRLKSSVQKAAGGIKGLVTKEKEETKEEYFDQIRGGTASTNSKFETFDIEPAPKGKKNQRKFKA